MTWLLTTVLLAAAPAASLDDLTGTVVQQATHAVLEPPVGIYVEGASTPLSRSFTTLLANRLAARKLGPVVVEARSAAEAEHAAREWGLRSLLRLSLKLEGQRLVVRGDGLGTWVNFWSGAPPTRNTSGTALLASTEADADTLLLAGVTPPTTGALTTTVSVTTSLDFRLAVLAHFPAVPAALALADLDGDHRAEILVLVAEELIVLSGDGKVLQRIDVSTLPPSPTPSRDAFGAIGVLTGPTRIAVWSARRTRAQLLTWSAAGLKPVGLVDAVPLEGLVTKLEPVFNHFFPDVVWSGKTVTMGPFQALSARGGLALVLGSDGAGSLVRAGSTANRFTGIGCGSTLADVDGDGTPEVIASTPKTAGDTDELRVLAPSVVEALAAHGGTLPEAATLWQGALGRGRAVVAAGGDLDGDGAEEVVLGVWLSDGTGELHVLRRTP